MDKFPISIGGRPQNRALSIALNIILFVLVLVIVLELTFFSRFRRFYVVGRSMYPTLVGAEYTQSGAIDSSGDYVYADRFASPERGDIVIITTDNGDGGSITIIKRVIAFAGESVELVRGVLYINGEETAEPYVSPEFNTPSLAKNTYELTVVPEGCIFVLGDNRDYSVDSRGHYGMIDVDDVEGVVAEWSLSVRWLVNPFSRFFDFTLPNVFSGCSN